ncbi:hypothetical protein ACJJIF_05640 [Microbulbifer sp. SSSA002]|uniref:hypothetical protein n=1 Tax=Microbulbifer sp. SSSA002 TaxID=3243376 RepID=UPI004039C617
MNKRKVLAWCVGGLVCIGLLFSLYPFVESLGPSAVTEEPLEINLGEIPRGTLRVFDYAGRPVAVYRSSEQYVKELIANNKLTNGPFYKEGTVPPFFIYYLQSTYRGCYLYESKEYVGFKSNVPLQGLFDPCHMGFWDYSGRFIREVNSSKEANLENLESIKDYYWKDDNTLRLRSKPRNDHWIYTQRW